MMLLTNTQPVLIQVRYYLPEYPSILQEFTWGYEDLVPQLFRTHRFLNHWKLNIDAVIAEVLLSIDNGRRRSWRSVDEILNLNYKKQ